jgi:hypothetical protein
MNEFEYIKEFIREHQLTEYYIPPDYKFLSTVANTPNFIREYFEWRGKKE